MVQKLYSWQVYEILYPIIICILLKVNRYVQNLLFSPKINTWWYKALHNFVNAAFTIFCHPQICYVDIKIQCRKNEI